MFLSQLMWYQTVKQHYSMFSFPNTDATGEAQSFPVKTPPPPFCEIVRIRFASRKLSHLLICAAPPVGPTVNVKVLSGLQGPFNTLLCEDASETSSCENVFLKSQQILAAGDGMNLSFINKQKLMYMAWEPTSDETRIRHMQRQELESQSHSWCH